MQKIFFSFCYNTEMDALDPMVSALIALCKREGGERFVADRAFVSAENLTQIIRGVKLPSGNNRGVGPKVRAKLTQAYPNWLDLPQSDAIRVQTKNAITPVQQAQTSTNNEVLSADCQVICRMLQAVSIDRRDAVVASIIGLIQQARESPTTHQDKPETGAHKRTA